MCRPRGARVEGHGLRGALGDAPGPDAHVGLDVHAGLDLISVSSRASVTASSWRSKTGLDVDARR